MKHVLLITLFFAAICITGCRKDPSGLSPVSSSDSYFPVTPGSMWRYGIDGVTGIDTETDKVSGGTTTINGKQYFNFLAASKGIGSTTGYVYEANHVISIRGSNMVAGITIELPLLNDTLSIGNTWATTPTDNGMVNGTPARTVNTMMERGITKTVGGKTFTNVIHTQIDLQYDFGSGFESFALYNYYMAKGIGIISNDATIFGLSAGTENIIDYTIK